jgi:hypothetical protein
MSVIQFSFVQEMERVTILRTLLYYIHGYEYRVCKYGCHLNGSFVGQSTKYLKGTLCRRSSCQPPNDRVLIIWLSRDECCSNKSRGACSGEGQTLPRILPMTGTSLLYLHYTTVISI